MASFRQRLFGRVEASLSGGYEQNESLLNDSGAEEDPYYFVAAALGLPVNRYVTLQTQVRTSSRRNNFVETQDGQQTRASISLSLTF